MCGAPACSIKVLQEVAVITIFTFSTLETTPLPRYLSRPPDATGLNRDERQRFGRFLAATATE
jgi:hypothetical protein